MESISDLWDDDAECSAFIDEVPFATIRREMMDVGITSRKIRVSGYCVSFDDECNIRHDAWFDAKLGAKAAYKMAKDHVRSVAKLNLRKHGE